MSEDSVVIVGAGHAGVQAAASLREEGFEGPIALLSDEAELPYQRPPLSKAFLKGQMDLAGLPLRAEKFFADHRIDLRLGEKAKRIDRAAGKVELVSGSARRLRSSDPRDRRAAARLARAGRRSARRLYAARDSRRAGDPRKSGRGQARRRHRRGLHRAGDRGDRAALGGEVTIVEIARPLGRAVSPDMSDFFLEAHKAFGAKFRLGVGVNAIHGVGGRATGVELSDGALLPADVVIVGVGVTAEDALAMDAGLKCANGIVVDEFLRTSDAKISAIGDCAEFPSVSLSAPLRLESVQNATDQARAVARRLTGKPEAYNALPWFWSDQGDLKLQIAGLSHGVDQWVVRGDPATRAFATFGFRNGALAVVETVNRGAEHMAARRIIGAMPLTPEQAADTAFDLRKLALAAKG